MNPIDAVISWVDGYDPVYQAKLKACCELHGIEQHRAVEPTRVQQCDEIKYCLHALRRFAPWIRTIYIITNQQTPAVVNELQRTLFGQKIKIIDQNELLNAQGVSAAIFNSISIEWLIWGIPGLSNQFLYLNDDFFIIRPVTPHDFFRNGRLVLRGEWKIQADKKWSYQVRKRVLAKLGVSARLKMDPHRAWQEKCAQLAGFSKEFYLLPHAPFPLTKTTFEAYKENHEDVFAENIRVPFRHAKQVSSIPLMVHLDIQSHRVEYDSSLECVMVNGETHALSKIKSRLKKAKQNSRIAFVCMQSLDQASAESRQFMMGWLERQIGTE